MTDRDGIVGIAFLIARTKVFSEVLAGLDKDGEEAPPFADPWCWVYPVKWGVEKIEGDEINLPRSRIVHFEIPIHVLEDPASAESLADAIQTAVHGQKVAETTSLICQDGSYKRFGGVTHPRHRLTVTGTFTYLIQ